MKKKKSTKMNISERSYWIALIVSFVVFCLFLGLWLIPQGFIEYSLGISLLTSSIFMVLTIVFLSWLFNVREKREWNIVKESVHGRIQTEISMVFDFILTYSKNGYATKLDISQHSNKEERNSLCLSALDRLNKASSIELDEVFSSELFNEESLKEIPEYMDRLSSILTRYSKFLSPELTLSLMDIEDCLEIIQYSIRSYVGLDKTIKLGFLPPSFKKSFIDLNKEVVSAIFKRMVEDIETIQGIGINVYSA